MTNFTGGSSTDASPTSASASASRCYPVDNAAATTTAGSSSFITDVYGKLYGFWITVSDTGGTLTFANHAGTAIPGIHPIVIASGQACPFEFWFGNDRGIPLPAGLSWICTNANIKVVVCYDHTAS